MEFARRASPIYQSSHRWELRAWSLFPRINLAIRPILRESVFKTLSSISRWQSDAAEKTQPHAQSRMTFAFAKTGAGERQQGQTAEARISRSFEYSNISMQTPLSRIFQRLAMREIETNTRMLFRSASLDITRRVVDERRRIEHYAKTETVTRQEQISRKVFEQAKETERKLTEQLAGASSGRFLPDMARGTPPVSAPSAAFTIEQLTEQVMKRIDDKIVAHKERMGRLF
jgi:hypothetical protein